jgi:hypothetical protein
LNISIREVVLAERLGQQLLEGVAFDGSGRSTRNPVAALEGAFAACGGWSSVSSTWRTPCTQSSPTSPDKPGTVDGTGRFSINPQAQGRIE